MKCTCVEKPLKLHIRLIFAKESGFLSLFCLNFHKNYPSSAHDKQMTTRQKLEIFLCIILQILVSATNFIINSFL